jgi:hypothetical protein
MHTRQTVNGVSSIVVKYTTHAHKIASILERLHNRNFRRLHYRSNIRSLVVTVRLCFQCIQFAKHSDIQCTAVRSCLQYVQKSLVIAISYGQSVAQPDRDWPSAASAHFAPTFIQQAKHLLFIPRPDLTLQRCKHMHAYRSDIVMFKYFLWRNNPKWARASSVYRLHDQTQIHHAR